MAQYYIIDLIHLFVNKADMNNPFLRPLCSCMLSIITQEQWVQIEQRKLFQLLMSVLGVILPVI